MSADDSYGRLEFLTEGYFVDWDFDGLKIKATDYHVTTLHLTWDVVLHLMDRGMQITDKPLPRHFPRRHHPMGNRWVLREGRAHRIE